MRRITGREQPIRANSIIQRQHVCLRGPGDRQAAPKPQEDTAAPSCPRCHLLSPTQLSLGRPRGHTCHSLTFLCFLAIHLSQLLSISSHLDSRCRSTSKGTSSSLGTGERPVSAVTTRAQPPCPLQHPGCSPPGAEPGWDTLQSASVLAAAHRCWKRLPPVKSPHHCSPSSNPLGSNLQCPHYVPEHPGELCPGRGAPGR